VNTDVGGSVCTTARAWVARDAVPTATTKSRRPNTNHATGMLADVDQIRVITATEAVRPTAMSPNPAG
jgi:hypothetical protein